MTPPDFQTPRDPCSSGLTRQHVDDFMYRCAHDLRGPLATIQGLVNLLPKRKDETEVDRFVDLIDAHAKKIDERLHRLVYLAQSNDHSEIPALQMSPSGLETHLRKVIEKNSFVDFLELTVTGPEMIITDYNEILVKSLLANIVLHILRLEKTGTNCTIAINIHSAADYLHLSIESRGFISDMDFQEDIEENGATVYGELLQSPKFTYFYAAKKIAAQLRALMVIQSASVEHERIILQIPKPPAPTL